jgi:hypothetical protein
VNLLRNAHHPSPLRNIQDRIQNTEYRTQNTEYRIKNTEYIKQKLMYIRLPMYLFFIWSLYLMIWKGANPIRGPLGGSGPENYGDFFGP